MTRTLQFQDTQVAVPGFGAMGMSGLYGPTDDAQSRETLRRAVQLGCTFWDTAAIYGMGHNESLLGSVIAELGCRDKLFVASKCGLPFNADTKERLGVDNTPEHIRAYADDSTARLGFAPDLYYLHRIDPGHDLEAAVRALQQLKEEGKCRYIGLSECSAATLRKACAVAHIDALQIEYSLFALDHEHNSLLSTARELGVSVIAFGPLGKGLLTGAYRDAVSFAGAGDYRASIPQWSDENLPRNLATVDLLTALAQDKGCTPGQLAIAWVIAQGAIPIPGTKSIGRLEENWGAGEVQLSEEDLGRIRKILDEAPVAGERQPEAIMKGVGH